MDKWLNAFPALAYVNHLHTWVILNMNSEPISWTVDTLEVAWFSEWVSCKANQARFHEQVCWGQSNKASAKETVSFIERDRCSI